MKRKISEEETPQDSTKKAKLSMTEGEKGFSEVEKLLENTGRLEEAKKFLQAIKSNEVQVFTNLFDQQICDVQIRGMELAFEYLNSEIILYYKSQILNPEVPSSMLHWAARKGYTETMITLHELGADINRLNIRGYSPIYYAAEGGYVEAINILIKLGSNVNYIDNYGATLLHIAAGNGHADAIKILEAHLGNVNRSEDYGRTPLHWAVLNGHIEAVNTLIELGANVNQPDNLGMTPLQRAALRHQVDVIIYLIINGANRFIHPDLDKSAEILLKTIIIVNKLIDGVKLTELEEKFKISPDYNQDRVNQYQSKFFLAKEKIAENFAKTPGILSSMPTEVVNIVLPYLTIGETNNFISRYKCAINNGNTAKEFFKAAQSLSNKLAKTGHKMILLSKPGNCFFEAISRVLGSEQDSLSYKELVIEQLDKNRVNYFIEKFNDPKTYIANIENYGSLESHLQTIQATADVLKMNIFIYHLNGLNTTIISRMAVASEEPLRIVSTGYSYHPVLALSMNMEPPSEGDNCIAEPNNPPNIHSQERQAIVNDNTAQKDIKEVIISISSLQKKHLLSAESKEYKESIQEVQKQQDNNKAFVQLEKTHCLDIQSQNISYVLIHPDQDMMPKSSFFETSIKFVGIENMNLNLIDI